MGSREEQKEQRRNDILAAALELFIQKGYAATKITDIAKAVNMSTGLLFHYFESKEKLYEELLQIGVSGPQTMLQIEQKDPLKFFEEAVRMILESLTGHPLSANLFVFMVQAYYLESPTESVKEIMKQAMAIEGCVPLIQYGQSLGEFKQGDPLALSLTFWSAVQGVAMSFARDRSLPLPEVSWFLDILRA